MLLGVAGFALVSFSNIISNDLFTASSQNIQQIYEEVSETLKTVTESRWNYLSQIGKYIYIANDSTSRANTSADIKSYVEDIQEDCGFSDFYLLNESGNYITLDGDNGYIELGSELFSLIDDHENIVVDGSLPNRENMFFYAVRTEDGVYQGFSYSAVAFGYDLKAISSVLSVDAFDGKSDAYLVRINGRVGTNVGTVSTGIRNMFSFLAECGVSEEERDKIATDFEKGTINTIKINAFNEKYYFSYQQAGFNDWILVSLTPASVSEKSMDAIRTSSFLMMSVLGSALILGLAFIMGYSIVRSAKDRMKLSKEREMIFEAVSNHMDEIFMLYDAKTSHFLYVSPNVKRMLGVLPEDIYDDESAFNKRMEGGDHKELLDLVKPNESLYQELHMTNANSNETKQYTLEIYRQDEKNENLMVITLTDDTKELKARQEIEEAANAARSANQAKSTFLSNMSHDIRTPMNAIVGFTKLLEANAENSEKVKDYSKKILDSSNHLLGIINDILDISKIESGKTILSEEETNLSELATQLEDMMRPLFEAKNQTFKSHVSFLNGPIVSVDKVRLTQILQNLLSNAVKYTRDQGKIDFTITQLDYNENMSLATYRFTVADNGMGISEEFQKKIFEPFSREKNSTINKIQGTGLGLAITKNIVDLMGGSITLTSKLNEGTRFDVLLSLRVINEEPIKQEEESKDIEFSMQGLNILAAEDNALNSEILVDLLDMEGVHVDVAENGLEALKKFENSRVDEYDLILMDVQMPEMNGYDATKAIRASNHERAKTIPIIAMTANAFSEDIQTAIACGMNAYLTKPIDMDALKAAVKKVAGGGQFLEN